MLASKNLKNWRNPHALLSALFSILLASCSQQNVDPKLTHEPYELPYFESLFVPDACRDAGRYIYEDLRLEKYRHRYNFSTLQALVDLTMCLNENNFKEEAGNIGLETLLLSQMAIEKPKNIEFVAQIVSESEQHSYAMRAWADWTFVSTHVKSLDDLIDANPSVKRINNEMTMQTRSAYGHYFEKFQELRDK